MIEFTDMRPDVAVPAAEYQRLLGYPSGRTLDGRAAELAGQARDWYEGHGRPWINARQADTVDVEAASIRLDGVPFTASRLRAMLRRAQADEVAVGGVRADAPRRSSSESGRNRPVRSLSFRTMWIQEGTVQLTVPTPDMTPPLLDTIIDRPLLADGAMGTQLFLAGLEQGGCGEAWNLTHPERVLAIQRRYVDAGSDCLLTNTFGGSRIMLARHGHAGEAAAINAAAVGVAREAFGGRPGYVIGDIGPFGGLLEPLGDAREADVREAFEEQARALVDAGVDAIIIETQTSLEELGLGLRAARDAGAPCVIGSMAYDVTRDGSTFRTMMGVDPERAAAFMQEHGADIAALNCGSGMDMIRARDAVDRYRKAVDLPIMVQPNAGQPVLVEMKLVYDETPVHMGRGVVPLLQAGARIIGGCCGSTPEHIREFRRTLDAYLQRTEAGA